MFSVIICFQTSFLRQNLDEEPCVQLGSDTVQNGVLDLEGALGFSTAETTKKRCQRQGCKGRTGEGVEHRVREIVSAGDRFLLVKLPLLTPAGLNNYRVRIRPKREINAFCK